MADEAQQDWKPPYVAYTTLTNFLDKKCGDGPVPPRIDKTFLDNYSGGTQSQLFSALKTIGFIDEDHATLSKLTTAAQSPEERKSELREWARAYYDRQITLAHQSATAQMLYDSFRDSGYAGSTLRKAIVFYLSLTDDLELAKSPHFRAPKQAPGKKRSPKQKPNDEIAEPADDRSGAGGGGTLPPGERRNFKIAGGGLVTLFADVPWLQLDADTFSRLREVITALESLADEVEEIDDFDLDDDEGDL